MKWTELSEKIPEEGKRLFYFFEGTGSWSGFYFGRDEEYPCSNNHVFGSQAGFLTGDVTHWCYVPDYPEDAEWCVDADFDFFNEMKREIFLIKEAIN